MSSTNRGVDRRASDYYMTPQPSIREFLLAFEQDVPVLFGGVPFKILDPCAGGDAQHDMAYPLALETYSSMSFSIIDTLDIRADSRASMKEDYLAVSIPNSIYGMVITNPPFGLALAMIQKALRETIPGGYVIMLLRLNFFGSQERSAWFKLNMPVYCYVHSRRIDFVPEDMKERIKQEAKAKGEKPKGIGVDSIEYMHAVWQVGEHPKFTLLRVI